MQLGFALLVLVTFNSVDGFQTFDESVIWLQRLFIGDIVNYDEILEVRQLKPNRQL
jgi:hypothetical protein